MTYNKVVLEGETLMDISNDSVTPETLLLGETAHDASGEQIVGAYSPSGDALINSRYDNGAVPAGDGYHNAVYQTDELGNPHWGEDHTPAQIELHNVDPESHTFILNKIKDVIRTTNMLDRIDKEMQAHIDELQQKVDTLDMADSEDLGLGSMSELINAVNKNRRDIANLTQNVITTLRNRLNAVADSDDETLDQLSEIVAYIKSNKSLIDNVTTSKVSKSDIVNELDSTETDKPLSAYMGNVLTRLSMVRGSGTTIGIHSPFELFKYVSDNGVITKNAGIRACMIKFKDISASWVPTGHDWNFAICSPQDPLSKGIERFMSVLMYANTSTSTNSIFFGTIISKGTEETTKVTWREFKSGESRVSKPGEWITLNNYISYRKYLDIVEVYIRFENPFTVHNMGTSIGVLPEGFHPKYKSAKFLFSGYASSPDIYPPVVSVGVTGNVVLAANATQTIRGDGYCNFIAY